MSNLSERDMKIIMILSDEKGHSISELSALLKIAPSNLSKLLTNLRKEHIFAEEGSLRFTFEDIIDPLGLADKLRSGSDEISKMIFDRFDPDSKQTLLESSDSDEISLVLVNELNEIVNGPSICKEKYFANANLSERSKRMIRQRNRTLEDRAYLNRFLLEDAFPEHLISSTSIDLKRILRRSVRDTTRMDSQRPGQQECPYYITRDLWTLGIIIEYFESNDREYTYNISHLIEKIEKEIKRSDSKASFSNQIYEQNRQEVRQETQFKRHNIFYWLGESDRNFSIMKDFVGSAYIGSLIKEFGIDEVLDALRFSDITEEVQAQTLSAAFNEGYISREEAIEEDRRRGLDIFSPQKDGRLFVRYIPLRRFIDIERLQSKS